MRLGLLLFLLLPPSTGLTQPWFQDGFESAKPILVFDQNEGGHGGFQQGAYQRDAAQPSAFNWTRQSRFVGPTTPSLSWKFPTQSGLVGTPIGGPVVGREGQILFNSWDGKLYALDPSGRTRWIYEFEFPDWNLSTPLIGADGTIYTGTFSHERAFYAITPDGRLKWKFRTDYWIGGAAIAADGTIYVGGGDGNLYALSPKGMLRWQRSLGTYIQAAPVVGSDGVVYVGSNANVNSGNPPLGRFYAVYPNGELKWSMDLGDIIGAAAIGSDGTIYVGSLSQPGLYAINPEGSLKWRFVDGEWRSAASAPAIGADGTIYFGAEAYGRGRLYAVSTDGKAKWHFETSAMIRAAPIVSANGLIYVGAYNGHLYALRANGALAWKYGLPEAVLFSSSPTLAADGTLYVGCYDGMLYAFQ